jgi:hypothetical protein
LGGVGLLASMRSINLWRMSLESFQFKRTRLD